jgi:hypothetical protein
MDVKKAEAKKATVYLERVWAYSAIVRAFEVNMDGRDIGSVRNGKTIAIDIDHGEHSIYIKLDWTTSKTINFFASDTSNIFRFRCGPTSLKSIPLTSIVRDPTFSTILKDSTLWLDMVDDAKNSIQPTIPQDQSSIELIETKRVEEYTSEDLRVNDNRRGSTPFLRKTVVSKKVIKTSTFERNLIAQLGLKGNIGIQAVASIESSLQLSINAKYLNSTQTEISRSDELPVEAPANTRRILVIKWKNIWQEGLAKIIEQSGQSTEVPYRVLVDIDFDTEIVDEN